MREDECDRVSRLGSEAWTRLKKCKDYNDWLKVGEALLVGREWAMNQAQTNKPEGKCYNLCFSKYLQRYKLDDMDKGDRSRLFQMMDALPQIEEWRRTLPLTERLKLNHPNAILRNFKAAFEAPDPPKPVKPGLRDSVVELSEENMQLKAHITELEEARTKEPLEFTLGEVRAAYIRCLLTSVEQESDLQVELVLLRLRVMEALNGKPANHREA
jgi:hypothetical protein